MPFTMLIAVKYDVAVCTCTVCVYNCIAKVVKLISVVSDTMAGCRFIQCCSVVA